LSQTAGAACCVEVWRMKNVSKCSAGGGHKITNLLRLSIIVCFEKKGDDKR